jgi:hypothetical protein
VKFAPCTWRIKQVGYSAANDRADDTEHDGPRDRQMHMHERLGHTSHEETDEDIPNEVKHIFLSNFCDLEINPAIAKLPIGSRKRNDEIQCRMTKEARMIAYGLAKRHIGFCHSLLPILSTFGFRHSRHLALLADESCR